MNHSEPIFRFATYDVRPLLPRNWQEDIAAVALQSGQEVDTEAIDLRFAVPDRRPLHYSVVTGDDILARLPWLFALYERDFLWMASAFAGEPLITSKHTRNAVNLNVLHGAEGSYEWHVDTNPITGLLFASDLTGSSSGGELVFQSQELNIFARVQPYPGRLFVFDARSMPHAVEPVRGTTLRISVPMNYYLASAGEEHSRKLDDHIFPDSEPGGQIGQEM